MFALLRAVEAESSKGPATETPDNTGLANDDHADDMHSGHAFDPVNCIG